MRLMKRLITLLSELRNLPNEIVKLSIWDMLGNENRILCN